MTDKTEKPKNLGGRPKGARNKSTLMKAQLLIDDNSLDYVKNLVALAHNDKDHFDMKSDIPATIVLTANKILLDKAIANEKEKEPAKKAPKADEQGKVKTPKVYASAS